MMTVTLLPTREVLAWLSLFPSPCWAIGDLDHFISFVGLQGFFDERHFLLSCFLVILIRAVVSVKLTAWTLKHVARRIWRM
ncbi:MAG TPA: hypothetical protein VFE58_06860 [Tepidisphaeraceae bacterium]|nr:hypothetical protein [Tepidisphaeraceae bacterium]